MQEEIRGKLLVNTQITLVAPRSLPRSEYKSKLLDYSDAGGE
jgi:hypothetical protein